MPNNNPLELTPAEIEANRKRDELLCELTPAESEIKDVLLAFYFYKEGEEKELLAGIINEIREKGYSPALKAVITDIVETFSYADAPAFDKPAERGACHCARCGVPLVAKPEAPKSRPPYLRLLN